MTNVFNDTESKTPYAQNRKAANFKLDTGKYKKNKLKLKTKKSTGIKNTVIQKNCFFI